jgi:outer membrane protein W
MRRITWLLLSMSLVCAPTAHAQSWEIAAMTGYVLPVDFADTARQVDSAGIAGGITYGFAGSYLFKDRWGAEVSWNAQSSAYQIKVDDVSGDLFSMTIHQVHGNLIYQFGRSGSRVQPFAFAGAGTTFFVATDIPMETHFSLGAGGGIKVYPWNGVGLRAQLRYRPTWLNDKGAGDFCDPFGFCQSTLRQLEFSGGVTFKF